MLRESWKEVKETEQTIEEEEGTTPPVKTQDDKRRFPVVLSYVKGLSKELRRVSGNFGTFAYFKPTNTLRQLLVRPKDPIDKETVVGPVYKITFENF